MSASAGEPGTKREVEDDSLSPETKSALDATPNQNLSDSVQDAQVKDDRITVPNDGPGPSASSQNQERQVIVPVPALPAREELAASKSVPKGRGVGVRHRLKRALKDGKYHDISFRVGKDGVETVSAHKLIIRLGSPIMESVLEGVSSIGKEVPVINMPDVEANTFRRVLEFMYTDTFDGGSIPFRDLMSLLQAAKTFQMPELMDHCVQHLKTQINEETAVAVCEIGRDIKDLTLRDLSIQFICRNPAKVFYSDSFMRLSYSNLLALVEQDELEWREVLIFKSVLRWADNYCRERGLAPVPENVRNALGEILYRIRFPVMTAEEFTFEVDPQKVLNSDEQVQIFKYLCISENSSKEELRPKDFNCQPRIYVEGKNGKDTDSLLYKGWKGGTSPHPSIAACSTEGESDDDCSSQASSYTSDLSCKRERPTSPLTVPSDTQRTSHLPDEVPEKKSKPQLNKSPSTDTDTP